MESKPEVRFIGPVQLSSAQALAIGLWLFAEEARAASNNADLVDADGGQTVASVPQQ